MRTFGGFSVFIPMSKIEYNKTPKTLEEQVTLLERRGLTIIDKDKAIKILANISYNRRYPLLAEPKEDEIFKQGSTFETIFRIYQFDADLRVLVFYAIEQIEIAVRSQIIYHLSLKYKSGFWFEDSTIFKNYPQHIAFVSNVCKSIHETKQEFITKYKNKYNNFLSPAWKSFELITFNSLNTLFKNLKDKNDQIPVSKHFGLTHEVFISWIETLVYIRNICAHHSRLWNVILTISPTWLKSPKGKWVSKWENESESATKGDKKLKMYSVLCMLTYLLDHINPHHKFRQKLKSLLKEPKYKTTIDIAHMGFPENWEEEPLWVYREVSTPPRKLAQLE